MAGSSGPFDRIVPRQICWDSVEKKPMWERPGSSKLSSEHLTQSPDSLVVYSSTVGSVSEQVPDASLPVALAWHWISSTVGTCLAEGAQWILLKKFTLRADARLLQQSFIVLFFLKSPFHKYQLSTTEGIMMVVANFPKKLSTLWNEWPNLNTTTEQHGDRRVSEK